MNKRVYLKYLGNEEIKSIEAMLSRHLGKVVTGTSKYYVYENTNSTEEDINSFINEILKDDLVSTISDEIKMSDWMISYEAVDGQYDQITEWSNQFIKTGNIKVSEILVFNEAIDLDKVKRLLVSPLEYQEKNMNEYSLNKVGVKKALKVYPNFINFNNEEMRTFYDEHGFAMEFEDLMFIQDYFVKEQRNPTETELLVLDTYWSDHCRHTTFMSEIEEVKFEDFELREAIENSFKHYLKDKEELGRSHKAISLMDITAQNGRYAKQVWNDNTIEVSDEVNACSIRISVDVDGHEEPWLLMFKNETHNHPTEIEPFGGASTCIGGAIRDPLSGRAYVYQAMRITGSGNVLETLEETRVDKLPQEFISKQAAKGYSHYADQIGISSSYVKEIYHDSYVAKRMECGAVVGAIKESDLIRQEPVDGDVVIMLGGRTGRDGVGGATGSSDVQTTDSKETNAAEVQKGNALEERKIIRLFKDPKISSIIKKSNDFGAGGVSVAIGELADGLEIDLDKVKLKYNDLNATEIAISESQERMAVVLDPKHEEEFLLAAEKENIEAVTVARVNNSFRLVIKDAQGVYVDLDRGFVDSGGITQKAKAVIKDKQLVNPLSQNYVLDKENILSDLGQLKNASQAGLAEYFNGSGALIKSHLGKTKLSPNIGSVESIPVEQGETNTVSMLTHGFIPEVSEYSPYVGGSLAVVESLSKTVAMGGDFRKVYFSFQEYFNRLTTPEKWGNVMQALLGTYEAQKAFKLCAIGGKDSMSGSYEDLDVVDTLVSFACSPQNKDLLVTSEFKNQDSYVYLIEVPMNDLGLVNYEMLIQKYDEFYELVKANKVLSASTTDDASIIVSLIKMAVGNLIGLDLNDKVDLSRMRPGSILFESSEELADFICIGKTTLEANLVVNNTVIGLNELIEVYTGTLDAVYPFKHLTTPVYETFNKSVNTNEVSNEIKVLVPIFPGTTGEYDVIKAFKDQGATADEFVYQDNPEVFAKAITEADIICFADGAMNGDVPSVAAFGVNVLSNQVVKEAIMTHLSLDKKILGFGNGFQLLVKTGLLPYETFNDSNLSFTLNNKGSRVSLNVDVVATKIDSIWTQNLSSDEVYVSSTYGKLVGEVEEKYIAFRYQGLNPTGSISDVEGLRSTKDNVFGRMGQINHKIVTNALSGCRDE